MAVQAREFVLADIHSVRNEHDRVVFRVHVLREDLRLELVGLTAGLFDGHAYGDRWFGITYFTRRIALTLHEFCRLLFHSKPRWRFCLRRDTFPVIDLLRGNLPADQCRRFDELVSVLGSERKVVEQIRNKASAHLDRKRVQRVLKDLADLKVPIAIGDEVGEHYFGSAVHTMLFVALPPGSHADRGERPDRFMDSMNKLAGAAMEISDIVGSCYLERKGVWAAGTEILDMARAGDLGRSWPK